MSPEIIEAAAQALSELDPEALYNYSKEDFARFLSTVKV